MATFQCKVVSAKESLFSGELKMLVAAGYQGELGVMAGHTPLITMLRPGVIRAVMADNSEEVIYASGGILEIQPGMVTVLADSAEYAKNLDEAKIAEARRAAEQLLANQSETLQTNAALASLAEAAAQLQSIRKYKNRS